jgi:molecular chaperone GrpE
MENQKEQHSSEEMEFKADNTHIEEELKEVAQELEDHEPLAEAGENVSEAEQLKAELAATQEKYLRLYSEFENFKRRTTKERADLFKSANQEVMISMIPVLDDFERAMAAISAEADKKGIELIYNKFKNTLTQKGLKEMEAKGLAFDPDFHEAITKVPGMGEDMKDKVVDVLEKGYFLGDKVIRFAKVVIGE